MALRRVIITPRWEVLYNGVHEGYKAHECVFGRTVVFTGPHALFMGLLDYLHVTEFGNTYVWVVIEIIHFEDCFVDCCQFVDVWLLLI